MPARSRLTLAFVGGASAALAAYATLRVWQAVRYGDADPALVIYSEHAAYFWRAWTAGYVGVMAAFAVWLAARANEARVAKALERAVVFAALLIAAQALFCP